MKFTLKQNVYKRGQGYEGPGEVVAVFKTWMGDWRYVVAHRISKGRGFFYHIYSGSQLEALPDDFDPMADPPRLDHGDP